MRFWSEITGKCAQVAFTRLDRLTFWKSVQLRPTVKPMEKALEFDTSLFERMWRMGEYTALELQGRQCWRYVLTILQQGAVLILVFQVQYRFSEDIARFPSHELYEGRLQTGRALEAEIAATLGPSSFP